MRYIYTLNLSGCVVFTAFSLHPVAPLRPDAFALGHRYLGDISRESEAYSEYSTNLKHVSW